MRLSSQRLLPVLALVAVGVAFLALTAGRIGGGSGAGDEAREVIEGAFGGKGAESGRFDAEVRVAVEGGAAARSGAVSVDARGAFDARGGRQAPKLDIDMSVDAPGTAVHAGVISTGSSAFVEFGRNAYELPRAQVRQLRGETSEGDDGVALAALGIDPRGWLQTPAVEGTEKVGGVETTHVSAGVDSDKMLEDFSKLAERTNAAEAAQAQGVSASDLEQAKGAIKDARVDVYAGESDGQLRKLTAQARLDGPQVKGTISFSLEMSDLGKPQRIEAPANARPFGQLRAGAGAGLLGDFGGGSGAETDSGARPRSGGSSARRDARGGKQEPANPDPGSAETSVPEAAKPYLDCVLNARTSAQIQKCAPLLE